MLSFTVIVPKVGRETLKCSCGCKRFNIDTNFIFRWVAFAISSGLLLKVTSGGRCIKHNREVGGAASSLHQCETKKCTAFDTATVDPKLTSKLYFSACESKLFNEVEWHKNDGLNFVHLGWDAKQIGNSFKII